MRSSDVSIPRRDGTTMRGHLALPELPEKGPAVVVLHEMFGLTADIRRITQRFAAAGYAALAPDLFDAPGSRALCIAKTLLSLRAGTGPAFGSIDAAREYLGSHPEVDGSRIGIVGFCMGGGFALLAALQAPYRVAAPYYGDVPRDVKTLEGICPVVGGYGGRDRLFAPQGKRLERHLDMLGVPHDVEIYPNAGHSYMSHHDPSWLVRLGKSGPMHVGYDEAAAEDSWRRMLAFFAQHL